jgi:hypothetical protein
MIIYLDFDGVLHHENVVWTHGKGIRMCESGHALFEWEPILVDLLEPHPDARIVLSTSWVRMKSFHYAKRCLCEPLQNRVIGATFSKKAMDRDAFVALPRGRQVLADALRRQSGRWFALDDDSEGWDAYSDKLILTNEDRGLSENAVQNAITEMLKRYQ